MPTKGVPANYPAWHIQATVTYRGGCRRAYETNRAALFIGNHFEKWNAMGLPNGASAEEFESIERWATFSVTQQLGSGLALAGAIATIADPHGRWLLDPRRLRPRPTRPARPHAAQSPREAITALSPPLYSYRRKSLP
ncbi:hypothetical protein [Streptomyces erythrochromogenes]|uniref:hypothetical protein n=1 Tax=Streptomyces erythrochromogenes TaxID=285574 RepID=UPI0038091949